MRIYVAFSGCSVVLFALMAWAYREFRTVARHKDGEARSIDLLDGESSNPQGSAVASRRPTVVFEYSRQGSAGISHYRSEIVAISNGAHEELPSDNRRKGLDRNGLNRLEAAALARPRDTSAERQLREQLVTAMSPDRFPGLIVRDVDCSAAVCRVSAEATTSVRPESWSVVQALSAMAPHGGVIATTDPDLTGERKVIAFIAKVGTRLPLATRE